MSTPFKSQRFLQLLLNDLRANYKILLYASGAIFSIFLIVYVSMVADTSVLPAHQVMYPLFLFVGGLFFTSMIFSDLHHPQQRYYFLTLPCSNIERFLSRFLITSVGYLIYSVLAYTFFEVIAQAISRYFFGAALPFFSASSFLIYWGVGLYMMAHSIVFLGALVFRKYHLVKTVLSLMGLGILCTIVLFISIRIVYWDFFSGFVLTDESVDFEININRDLFMGSSFGMMFKTFLEYFTWPIISVFFWTVGYLRLKETEV